MLMSGTQSPKDEALSAVLNIVSINMIELWQPDDTDPNKQLHLILEDGRVSGFVIE